MKIAPYRRRPPVQHVGLVTRTRRVILEDGSRPRLRDVDPRIKLYADAHLINARFLRRGDGKAISWNDRPVRWLADLDHAVYLLQGYPGDGDEIMDGIVAWRDRLALHGARVGSPAAASLSLLRTTLDRTLYLGSGRPRIPMVLGGRQEAFAAPGTYGAFVHVDLRSAYARTLGELVYPAGTWREWSGPLPADPELPMLVRARVRIPEGIGLIPRRPRRRPQPGLARMLAPIEYPTATTVQGIYNLAELRAAESAGAAVRPIQAWVHLGTAHRPFAVWWELIRSGRALGGYAGDLFKLAGNTLWGRFAIDGVRTLDRWVDGHRITEAVDGPVLPAALGAEDVSELVASTVRARLLSELIVPAGDDLLSVHTDGGLVRGRGEIVASMSSDWRVKHRGGLVIYLGPQMYAYRARGARELSYVVSGIEPEHAPLAFAGLCAEVIGWPPTTFGSVAARDRRRLVALARELGAGVVA